jgi:hypothetical protein
MGLGLMMATVGLSAGGAWNIFYAAQSISLIPAMGLSLPSCATYMYQTYRWANLEEDSSATWFRYVICVNDCGDSTASIPPTYSYIRAGFENTNILYNLADTITIVLLIFFIVIIVSLFAAILKNSMVIQNIDYMVRGRVLISIVHITYLKVAVTTMLNFQYFSPSFPSTSFNSFVSVAALVYVGGVPLFYIGHSVVFYKELKSLRKKMDAVDAF